MFEYQFIFLCVLEASIAHKFYIHNRCSETVWVGLLGNSLLDQGGFELPTGDYHTTQVPTHWSGRVWGRTHCGSGRCETGDCGGGRVECNGAGGVPPATLAEITFEGGSENNQDFYDISLVDGYNLQLSMEPRIGTYKPEPNRIYYCKNAGCTHDLRLMCPCELQVSGTGGIVACMSACSKFNSDEYCCRGRYSTPQTCPPFTYSTIFKSACPDAYSYAYDDQTSTFTCKGEAIGLTEYDINFC